MATSGQGGTNEIPAHNQKQWNRKGISTTTQPKTKSCRESNSNCKGTYNYQLGQM
jgi:hypothetical protein